MSNETRDRFLDVRRHGFVRVAVCVPECRVADPAFNVRAHLRELEAVYAEGARYAVCPELGLTAYSCGDLFLQSSLRGAAREALEELAEATRGWDMILSVGLPLAVDGALFNCAVTLCRGRPLAVVPKSCIPSYGEFYEARWFAPGDAAVRDQLRLIDADVPFGTDVLIETQEIDGFVLHTDICEDLWVPIPPGTRAALAGATILANLSASNITVAKAEYRRALVCSSSAKNLAAQLYSAGGFGESTSDMAWDGQGLIADRGAIVAETERFVLRGSHAVVDVDLEALLHDRMRQVTFAANARAEASRPFRRVRGRIEPDASRQHVYRELRRPLAARPFVPDDPHRRDERCREVFSIQATSLARRLEALPESGRRVVIGVSGGQDSSHALLVAVHAVDLLGLGRERVLGVTMPGLGTTNRTRANAERLVKALGATFRELPVGDLSEAVFREVGHPPQREDLTFENVQAWLRKLLLFTTASQVRAMDVGTGDLSELALGWCTYGGDHISHYGVNAGVPKTLITYLMRWTADVIFADETQVRTVLEDILETPISPELHRPGPGDTIEQRSEDAVGPYELQDFFLYHFLRFGGGPQRLARMALHAFADRYALAEIRRWLIVFLRRFFASQYKRDCVPDGPKVGSGGSLSPRGDWRMPSDASAARWIAEAEQIPD